MPHFPIRTILAVAALGLAGCAELADLALLDDVPTTTGSTSPGPLASSATTRSPGPLASSPALGSPSPSPVANIPRALVDLPDESTDFQFHPVYMIPSDGEDRAQDTSGKLRTTLHAVNDWMKLEADGSTVRFDTANGEPDVTFLRMKSSSAEMAAGANHFMTHIRQELLDAGFDDPRKHYVAYYDGEALNAVGASGLTAYNVSVVLCRVLKSDNYIIVTPHEMVHAMGFPRASCAPHFSNGHIKDGLADVIGDGNDLHHVDPRFTRHLDPGHDDYYKAYIPGCQDLAQSAFLDPLPADVVLPTDRPLVSAKPAGGDPVPAPSNPEIKFSDLTLAQGPAGSHTVTLSGQVVLKAGSENKYVFSYLSPSFNSAMWVNARKPHPFYVSIPATGTYPVNFQAYANLSEGSDPTSYSTINIVDGKLKKTR